MRLIDADRFIDHLKKTAEVNNDRYSELEKGLAFLVEAYATFKEVDAVPVRHGKWKLIRMEDNGDGFYTCSNCDRGDIHSPLVTVPYCWYCGARMDADAE